MEEVKVFGGSESRMLSDTLDSRVEGCRAGQPAPCTKACPYDLDMREVVKKLKRGNFRSAYSILVEKLIFPETLCSVCGAPCEKRCAEDVGIEGVRLSALERSIFEYVADRKPPRFRVPPKGKDWNEYIQLQAQERQQNRRRAAAL